MTDEQNVTDRQIELLQHIVILIGNYCLTACIARYHFAGDFVVIKRQNVTLSYNLQCSSKVI